MCGIAGIISINVHKKSILKNMLEVQNHRGPDFNGTWNSETIILGHNRLAILDLQNESNQPFESACGNFVLTFNGEIYNYLELKEELKSTYTFKTFSDTEVLLAAFIRWGKDCLHRLNGMFSFAVWQVDKQELFVARDRFGVKPFYYHKNENDFYFASEIKALHAAGVKKEYNETVWASYLAYGSYGMPNETFWEGVQQLPGGHFLEIKKNDVIISKWYVFEEEIKKYQKETSFNTVKETYKNLLKDSILLRFRADVNVGFNISGGLDSSTLLAFVNQIEGKENISAYTFYTGDERYDEIPWVEEMIALTKNPLQKVLLKADKQLVTKLEYVTKIQDEPYGGVPTVAYSQIFKQARKDNVIVLLDGQGMDEQWAGYDYYLKNNTTTIQGVTQSPFRKNILSQSFKEKAQKPEYPKPFKDDVLNKQYRDLFYTKIPRTLRFNDRISMAYSTELREPFLDYRLVEYAFSQPLEYKINKGVQKYLVREIVSEYLTDTITYAPKRPLQTPQREWLGNEVSGLVEDNIVRIKRSNIADWFNFSELEKEWKLYKNGSQNSSFHIWQWVNLGMLIGK